ncbi:unnamed protein product [Chironomus riparius]|uniref:Neural proliferation differentiation and control protein 1 n=1 Tax=Chironomus riparius TaxID=315576 RepID=A0A9N9RJB9_9DIPT|nr:unnamed protein product [Chironomus riparius]
MRKYIDFSIEKKRLVKKLCFTKTYGSRLNMNLVILILAFLALFSDYVAGEYSGRRRHQYNLQNVNDNDKEYLIEQLSNYIEEQARRKFQQQMQFQQHHQKQYASVPQQINGPGFSFQLPQYTNGGFGSVNDDFDFAVTPFDPRYYEPSTQNFEDFDEQNVDDDLTLDTEIGVKTASVEVPMNENKNKILIPSPMHVNDAPSPTDTQSQRILHRAQQKQLQQQQQQLLNKQTDVLQKPLQVEFDNTTSLYIVALIAGLSCAFSTGLIALALMYYTLKKKVKTADPCDYACDYAIVGPRNIKSMDPQLTLGDKKLAHSAQMFHYQHQKNQIIAMENNRTEMGHNDDENDSDENENDFTVYECPGLAEWSDSGIEVKNPLFSEETPATKTEKAQPTNKTTTKK